VTASPKAGLVAGNSRPVAYPVSAAVLARAGADPPAVEYPHLFELQIADPTLGHEVAAVAEERVTHFVRAEEVGPPESPTQEPPPARSQG
jgi:hypothetical protein